MKKDKIIKLTFIVIMIAVIAIAAYYVSQLNMTSLENHEFYQYFAGKKIEYTGELEVNRENSGISNLKMNDVTIQLDSTPVYYKDVVNKMLLPENMAVITPSSQGKMQRINYFSEIELKYDIPVLQYEEKEQSLEGSFLFDGSDLYVFLENTTITIGDQKYEMSPLSYAIVTYKQAVELYQKDKDTYHMLEEITDGNIKATTANYEINLSTDALLYGGKEQLLLKNIEKLPNYEWYY